MSICQPMSQHYNPIDLPQGLPSPPSANTSSNSTSSRIPTPLSVIMKQQQLTMQAQAQEPLTDSVNSLRALALSTMRFKRKRAGSDARPPRRPASTAINTVTLDYGSDAQSPQDEMKQSALPIPKQDMPPPPDSHDSREEGEISDEEDTRSSSPAKTPTPALSPLVRSLGQPIPQSAHVPPASTTSSYMSLASDLPHHSTIRVNAQPLSPSFLSSAQSLNLWTNWVPTEDHVRPGLRMNMEQFNLVKELILDLLGWGVTPEHLIDCGLTREAVFYAFSELNLKLPDNLDPNAPQDSPLHIHSLTLPKPPLPSRRSSLSHSLPMKPSDSPVTSTATPLNNLSPSTVTPNLSDMEAQRRQELLARKAVMASRRKKAEPSGSKEVLIIPPSSTSVLLPDEPMSIAPSEAVDSFLNSMLEASTSTSSSSDVDPASLPSQTHNSSAQSSKPPTPRLAFAKTADYWVSTATSTMPSSAATTPPVSRRSPTPSSISYSTNGRRGAKRPVAMDFVDDGSFATPVVPSYGRRKNSSFAGLNAPRKCVIDLSDSEGEDEDDNITRVILQDDSLANNVSFKPLTRPPSVQHPTTAGSVGPPSRKPTPSPSAGDMSLFEKEEQIKRMREMIQKREQDRLRRLAEKTTTPVPSPPPTQTPPVSAASTIKNFKPSLDTPVKDSTPPLINLKQESPEPFSLQEVDLSEAISDDQAEEDIVMQNLAETSIDDGFGLSNGFQVPVVQDTIGEPGQALEPEDIIMSPPSTSRIMISSPKDDVQASSTQDQRSTDNSFSYVSPFSLYPLLRARMTNSKQHSGIDSDPKSPVSVDDLHLAGPTPFALPDLQLLRTTVLLRVAGPNSFICQYEVPGGGICRDKTCMDLHLCDTNPNDQETAQFLKDSMVDELARFSASDVEGQLAGMRRELTDDRGAASLDDVVRAALMVLCGRPVS